MKRNKVTIFIQLFLEKMKRNKITISIQLFLEKMKRNKITISIKLFSEDKKPFLIVLAALCILAGLGVWITLSSAPTLHIIFFVQLFFK